VSSNIFRRVSVSGTAIVPTPLPRAVIAERIENAEFIERYAAAGRVGLSAGTDFIHRSIRKL